MKKRFPIPGFTDKTVMSVTEFTDINGSYFAPKTSKRSFYLGGILAIITVGLIIGCGWFYKNQQQPSATPVLSSQTSGNYISNDQLESQYGIRVSLIAVTAAGGIVDFRYKVVDPQKAAILMTGPGSTPILTAVDTGYTLSPTKMGRHHGQMTMKRGAVPFTFYPNVRSAVKPGSLVSVSFGDVKVEPIAAQ